MGRFATFFLQKPLRWQNHGLGHVAGQSVEPAPGRFSRNAVATAYIHLDDDDFDPDFGWSDFLEDIRDNVLKEKYPSLTECDRWRDRENHVILENCQIEVSVSEYCGLVAVCLAPIDADNGFFVAVAERMAKSFHATVTGAFKSNALVKLGSFSNGEGVFQKVN